MQLRPSQNQAVSAITADSRLLIADMGSGKTATALTTVRRRRTLYGKVRTLVISTVRVCKYVWPDETRIWSPDFQYSCAAEKTPEIRRSTLEAPYLDIVGINFENLPWLEKTYGTSIADLFPNLIVDESSKLENPGGTWFKALAPSLPKFVWRLPMTGTPRANHLMDLWGHAYLVDQGKTLGKYRETYRKKYFKEIWHPINPLYTPLKGAEEEIYVKLSAISHRLQFDGDKPEVVEIDVPVEAPKASIAAINKMKQVQIDSGAVYEPDGTTTILNTAKIDTLQALLSNTDEPVLIVYNFVHELTRLRAAFPSGRLLDTQADVDDWNAGSIDTLFLHPLSAGHGLNIQKGGSIMVWYSPPPTEDAELYAQMVARLARSGNSSPLVRVYRLIAGKDAQTYKGIKTKLDQQERALYFR